MNEIRKIDIENIQRIDFDKFEKDFSFIVNGQVYQTNSIIASVLSPDVWKLFEEGTNKAYYEINTKYRGDFNRIIEYGEMKAISINKEEQKYFKNIMKELGNINEILRNSEELQTNISYENVIKRIKIKSELNINLDEEITFISSNFHDFHTKYPEAISKLNIDIIERIISNEKLKLLNEKELFDILLKLYMKSNEYSILFSYILFMNLSAESLQKFHKHFDINDINKSIWEAICIRLEQDISHESKTAYQKSHQEFLNKRYIRKPCNIIEYLSEQCQGNVHSNNIVHITSSSHYCGDIASIVGPNDGYFFTNNEANSWIQFDFIERKVLLDSYTIKSTNYNANDWHLKNWILEVSNDGENYEEIDRHENCDLLNGRLKTETFKVSCLTPQRFVRLKQTGPTWNGNYYLAINHIEFSGFFSEYFL